MVKDNINGLQHIGIPTADMEQTLLFYQGLGFRVKMETRVPGGGRVAFLTLGDLMIETYEGDVAPEGGAINHISLDVSDIQKAYDAAKEANLQIETDIEALPFWEKGIRYFIITGPNNEAIEFCQKLS